MNEQDDFGKGIYRQEAAELVQSIEAGLIALEQAPRDSDLLNAVFRDLHTVKGSGAMFGFTEVAMFVHEFETVFDRLRRGETEVDGTIIAISLKACDQILPLLDAPDSARSASAAILAQLEACLGGGEVNPEAADPSGDPDPADDNAWPADPMPTAHQSPVLRVTFRLEPAALVRGHDPGLLLDDLRALGPCRIAALADAVPRLDKLDPTACLLGWQVDFLDDIASEAVEAVFVFTRDAMELEIVSLVPTTPMVGAGLAVPPTGPAPRLAAHPDTPPEVQPAKPSPQARVTASGDTMRVATERLDELMDRVGELVIAETRLHALARSGGDANLLAVAEDIQRLAAALRDSTMSIRMVPLSSILGRFQRLIRDLSSSLGKPITFVTQGEDTALDKTVLEHLADPLVHLLRNCADHGLEAPAERLAAGKPATGTIELAAEYSGAEVVISIRDDGRGLDVGRIRSRAIERGLIPPGAELPEPEIMKLIFEPGFSTAPTVTELSGRGVGMDVVKRTIAGLRGTIDLASEPGHGTTVRLRLPLTLAIIDGLLVEVGGEHYTIPLAAVEECVELSPEAAQPQGGSSFLNIRGSLVPFLRLRTILGIASPPPEYQKLVVVTSSGARVGLAVDRIVSNNQTVIKQLSRLHAGLKGFSGATILGDGSVALILDVAQLVSLGRSIEDRTRRQNATQERAA